MLKISLWAHCGHTDIIKSVRLKYVQLHGSEDEEYIKTLKKIGVKVIKSISIKLITVLE